MASVWVTSSRLSLDVQLKSQLGDIKKLNEKLQILFGEAILQDCKIQTHLRSYSVLAGFGQPTGLLLLEKGAAGNGQTWMSDELD